MANDDIEKVRQEIMRFRELLTIMQDALAKGERAYDDLFSGFVPEEIASTKKKDMQWKVAEKMVADVTPLRKAVMKMRFDARELEHAFEELYDIIVSVPGTETE